MKKSDATKESFGGVWHVDRPGRPKPFGVQWREVRWDEVLKRERKVSHTEFFKTEEQRSARAAQVRRDKRKGSLVTADRGEIEDIRSFKAAIGDTPWRDVVAGWRSWQLQSGIEECQITVDKAVEAHLLELEGRVKGGTMSKAFQGQRGHKIGLFKEQFGHLRLNQVTAAEVESWIDDYEDVRSKATFNAWRKHFRALFQPYAESGQLRRNPIDAVKLRDASMGIVSKLEVDATAYLFSFAMGSAKYKVMLGRLALEAFLGLRFSSGCRIEKSDINYQDRGILLPKHKIKTRKRHYIDGIPDQVWAWLAITPEECWDLTARQYMELKSNLFTDAGVPHPHNCLRHSFATYDVAAHKNPGRTAYLLCHKDQVLLWENYKGNAFEADGKLYQSITPQTAKELAKGFVPLNAPARQVA